VNQGLDNLNIMTLAMDPANPETLYASDGGMSMYRTTDAGESWTKTALRLYARTIAPAPGQPGTIYVGGGTGLFKTVDGGRTWQELKPSSR
jgi:photosystem II stability/assembly factor-like uncharacterized protein